MVKKVLYVEDNADAVVFFKHIIKKIGDYQLEVINNGREVLSRSKEDVPEMIILDIDLPGANGLEVLKHIRSKSEFKKVPVIMFTSSNHKEDIERSYAYGANGYLLKPDNLETMQSVLKDTFNFWLKHNVA